MAKKILIDAETLERIAHTMNAARSSIDELANLAGVKDPHRYWTGKDEEDFWKFINAIPTKMRESVIN